MAMTCPRCGAEYDVTLFAFGRRVRCDCGEWVDWSVGHRQPLRRDSQAELPAATAEEGLREGDAPPMQHGRRACWLLTWLALLVALVPLGGC